MSLGSVMLDIAGTSLTAEDRELLRHPQVGGLILFARNYVEPAQLAALTAEVHALRSPALVIAVDQEGGRIQRFQTGFTRLPAARALGALYDQDAERGLRLATEVSWLMATELKALGVDLSFAPVLDIDHGVSAVIGDRSFHRDPDAVIALGRASLRGLSAAGMAAVGKHFPGHGAVALDSHHSLPIDARDYADIALADLRPFAALAESGLAGVMPAHIVYPAVDSQPAGFSRRWLQGILRGELGFAGAIFSDDLEMAGAAVAGSHLDRAVAAQEAGCDMLLVCNHRGAAIAVVEGLHTRPAPASLARILRMRGHSGQRQGADLNLAQRIAAVKDALALAFGATSPT